MLLTAHTLQVQLTKIHFLRTIGLQSNDQLSRYLWPKQLVKVPASDELKLAHNEDGADAPAYGQADIALLKNWLLLDLL